MKDINLCDHQAIKWTSNNGVWFEIHPAALNGFLVDSNMFKQEVYCADGHGLKLLLYECGVIKRAI